MSNEVKEIDGIYFKDEKARKNQQAINIVNYSSDNDKTQAINEILSQNKNVFIPQNETISAKTESFVKEKLERFEKSGKILFVPPDATTNINSVGERDLSKRGKIYNDMVLPSEFKNNIKWFHQLQSWLWDYNQFWKMSDYSSIVPWFQICKNPNFEGEVPDSFDLFLGKIQALAFDISKNKWVEVYDRLYDRSEYFPYYEGSPDESNTTLNTYSAKEGIRKISVNKSDILERAIHGFIGTSGELSIQTNPNYKYFAFRMKMYTNAPYGFIGAGLGLDLYKDGTRQEQGGSRNVYLTNEEKYIYFSNVPLDKYDEYISDDMFNVFDHKEIMDLSENERIVGRFLDGRPIYETTIKIENIELPANSEGTMFEKSIKNISNYDNVFIKKQYVEVASSADSIYVSKHFGSSSTLTEYFRIFAFIHDLLIQTNGNHFIKKAIVTIQYTRRDEL